jgi:mannose-1-phosphate guanylyltransferase/mannose-6-phosphate isomerase
MGASVHPVILSGGVGTRLWPLSRSLRPKQLLPLLSENSLLQDTVLRVSGDGYANPIILCNQDHRFLVAEQLRQIDVAADTIVLEPEGRNTAPAAIIAALMLREKDPDAIMLLLPADHVIGNAEAFHATVATAQAASEAGALVTFGVVPKSPETGYGYIQRGDPFEAITGCYHIQRFVEKPDLDTAKRFVDGGDHFWNSGMFVFPVAAFLEEAERFDSDLVSLCSEALANAEVDLDFLRLPSDVFAKIRPDSIDYAVMEKTKKGGMVPADFDWSDVGSWSGLAEISKPDEDGNVLLGEVFTIDAKNCYVRANERLVAAVGIEDLVIVATDDAVLVLPKNRSQDVKEIVCMLEDAGRHEQDAHLQVFRPWGWYRQISAAERFQVKEIRVDPGKRLSHQMHYHRAEHWVVVSGTAEVTKGEQTFLLTEDESTYIPPNTMHSLKNPGKIPLKMIEVQSGSYLGEDDIIRLNDTFGRVAP